MRFNRLGILELLFFLQCLQGWSHGQPSPPAVQILIGSEKTEYRFGDPVLIGVSVKNLTGQRITLARPLDQFESRFRYPHCIFELRNERGETVKPAWVGDKPPDPITRQAFFSLDAGQEGALYPQGFRLDSILPDTGIYSITLRYSTFAEKEWEWYGPYSDQYWENRHTNSFWKAREPEILEVRKLLKKLIRVAVSSNSLPIKIFPRNVTKEEALKIAEAVCRLEKWPWVGAHAIDRGDYWDINTNWGRLGHNGWVRIDRKTGKVLQKQMTGD